MVFIRNIKKIQLIQKTANWRKNSQQLFIILLIFLPIFCFSVGNIADYIFWMLFRYLNCCYDLNYKWNSFSIVVLSVWDFLGFREFRFSAVNLTFAWFGLDFLFDEVWIGVSLDFVWFLVPLKLRPEYCVILIRWIESFTNFLM